MAKTYFYIEANKQIAIASCNKYFEINSPLSAMHEKGTKNTFQE